MKKKLIAIVTSLAMVATMVPATAFAATQLSAPKIPKAAPYADTQKTAVENFTEAMTAIDSITVDGSATDYTSYNSVKEALIVTALEAYNQLAAEDVSTDPAPAGKLLDTALATQETKLAKLLDAVWKARKAKLGTDLTDIESKNIDLTDTAADIAAINEHAYLTTDATLYTDAVEGNAVYDLISAATTEGGLTNKVKTEFAKLTTDVTVAAIDTEKTNYTKYSGEIKEAVKIAKAFAEDGLKNVTASNITTSQANKIKDLNTAYEAITTSAIQSMIDATTISTPLTTLKPIATAFLADQEAINAFLDAVKEMSTPGNSYNKIVDGEVAAAADAYADLSDANVTAIKADAESLKLYQKFEAALEKQWRLRLDVLEDAVDAVTPVEADNLGAVDTLDGYGTRFNDDMYDVVGDASDKVNGAAGAGDPGSAPKIDINNGRLRTAIDDAFTAASDAYGDALLAKDIVEAIADLDVVTDSTYQAVKAAITAINSTYTTELADPAVAARIGNLSELTAKTKAVTSYETAVTNVDTLAAAIAGKLAAGKLTESEIDAYTEAYKKALDAYNKLGKNQKVALDGATVPALDTAEANIYNYAVGLDKETTLKHDIDTLPNGIDAADALAIAKAQYAYDQLSSNAKGTIADLADGFQLNVNDRLTDLLKDKVRRIIGTLQETDAVANEARIAEAVAPVKALIAALPATITSADADAVEEAVEAYNAIVEAFGDNSFGAGYESAVVATAIKNALKDDVKVLRKADDQLDAIKKQDEQAVARFVKAVEGITGDVDTISDGDVVTSTYRNGTVAARAAYDALTDAQKELVDADAAARKAYKALEIAEANLKAAATVLDVAALIKAVPNAATLDVKDADAVAKVKAAQEAYEALTPGVRDNLVPHKYITQAELDNYLKAVKKVTDAETKVSVAEVEAAIKALITLPTKFSNQAEVNAAYTLLKAAEEGFDKLSKEQQDLVGAKEKQILTRYRVDFDRLITVYANELYKKAAAMDPKALTAEDIAVIAELKAYIDGDYIETKKIDGFDQKVYDALTAGLDDNAALENATIADIPAVTYTGAEQKPAVTVTDKSGKEVPTDAYEVTYSNNKDAGTALVTVSALTGKGYTGVTSKSFTINPANIKTAKAAKIANQIYNKKAKTPAVSVTAGSKKLVKDADYKVAYKNNTNIGKATVTITGTENYTGTITTTFIITPAKGKLTSLKAGKKQITVSYEAQKASGKTGYYLVYSPAKGKAKTTTSTATKKTIKGLKSGTSYKVKVRAYKTIGGKKYYGKYSDVKKVKVK